MSAKAALTVSDLHVGFGAGSDYREVVKGVSFSLDPGECLAIVGESGSGKSVTARALIGLAGSGSRVAASTLELHGRDVREANDRTWRGIRGKDVGFVLQDALVSLDPLRPVGKEIVEALKLHRWGDAKSRHARVLELLEQVGVPEPQIRARQLPGELSGGLRQRALIASAIALDPGVLIADEPTTALDVTVQAQILELLEQTKARGKALLVISHDLAVVSRLADRVAVMNQGVIVEYGPTSEVLFNPRDSYTRRLLDAVPSTHSRRARLSGDASSSIAAGAKPVVTGKPIITAENLTKSYKGPDGVNRTVVKDVSFVLGVGETLGVVGESGSGKTTVARLVLAVTAPDSGRVLVNGEDWSSIPEKLRRPSRRLITSVYQDPLSSFDPRWTVGRIITDALPAGEYPTPVARRARVDELLGLVGLGPEHLARRPLHLSGGQRQRVAIARALAPEPAVIVCDESVSALDVSIQAQVLDLLADIQQQLGVSYLFISHDLGVIHHVSDRILVMHNGRIVEQGPADEIFTSPRDPYTQQLLSSLPTLEKAHV
ncbi:MAG: peptide/nickel transport system ATP-binding protein ddpF [Actinomycetota bacterium]|nr:peptide/nickel transport system ATP-binding protein ddpF [Actinomycetota bacterium]MDQ1561859.1 peptide/nickel transport system ATP-binding protein ddpF [Actinomycetota bacterium]MDQ1574360.1 peptide/nickel transport system ATP-binding protein ddpF [Actinomycetota bacterium]